MIITGNFNHDYHDNQNIAHPYFQVLFATFDGASVNRKLIKLHGLTSKELTHKVINPYSSESRYLYFISDPPHLMKTTRNCWFNNNLWVIYDCQRMDACI